ncbi:MAG: DUF1801 domain-containing protein [Flavobacteriales bacterium]|nr:DUF1801 domain-containing protein [Flavobacteriales bacterium]
MDTEHQIKEYIDSQPDSKRSDLETLHSRMLYLLPNCKLWFLDGKDEHGKVVTNPNIGYGLKTIKYANGKTKDFYQVGISGNTTGISVYIMGFENKKYLSDTYGKTIGKASVTGYCIKFKSLKDVNMDILDTAILDAIKHRI